MSKEQTNPLMECIAYCKEVNGMPRCKNCGLTEEMIIEAQETARRERDKEYHNLIKPLLETLNNPKAGKNWNGLGKEFGKDFKALTNNN